MIPHPPHPQHTAPPPVLSPLQKSSSSRNSTHMVDARRQRVATSMAGTTSQQGSVGGRLNLGPITTPFLPKPLTDSIPNAILFNVGFLSS